MDAGSAEEANKVDPTVGFKYPNAERGLAGLPELPKDPGTTVKNSVFSDEINKGAQPTPLEDYIQAQHIFVEAQMDMIHHQDVPRFATAQETYILAQTRFIASLIGKR